LLAIFYCQSVCPWLPIPAELAVSIVLLILLVFFISLAILLAAGSLAIQGYIYNEPVGDIFWRAPAAAAVVTAFLAFWCYLNYRAANPKAQELPYETLFTSAATYDASEPKPEIWAERANGRTHYRIYKFEGIPPRHEYKTEDKRLVLDRSIEAIVIKEGDPKQPVEVRFVARPGENKFVEEGGSRYLPVDDFGRVYTPRPGRSSAMILLNVVHFAVWFLAIWLLLRFQWLHALGLAAAIWLAMTMLVGPLVFAKIPRKPVEPASAITWYSRGARPALVASAVRAPRLTAFN
jgi:hypothetical protein